MKIERLNDYQDAARKTAIGHSLDHFVLGLVEEAGEAAGVLKRFHRGDERYRIPLGLSPVPKAQYTALYLTDHAKDKLIAEVGDVLWYAAMIADLLEVRLEDVATMNIAKLQDRAKRNVIQGEGDNR